MNLSLKQLVRRHSTIDFPSHSFKHQLLLLYRHSPRVFQRGGTVRQLLPRNAFRHQHDCFRHRFSRSWAFSFAGYGPSPCRFQPLINHIFSFNVAHHQSAISRCSSCTYWQRRHLFMGLHDAVQVPSRQRVCAAAFLCSHKRSRILTSTWQRGKCTFSMEVSQSWLFRRSGVLAAHFTDDSACCPPHSQAGRMSRPSEFPLQQRNIFEEKRRGDRLAAAGSIISHELFIA